MNGIEPVTYDFSFSYCYFELDEKMNNKFNAYLKDVLSEGHVVSGTMLTILKFYLLLFITKINV